MELKERYEKFFEIFDSRPNETFSQIIMRVVSSENYTMYFDKYCHLFDNDLSKDMLRSCWQFWNADRNKKCQDYTSDNLSDIVANLLEIQPGDVIYDCCAGSGSLSLGCWRKCDDVTFICEELDDSVVPLQLFNFAIRNIRATVRVCDVITRECSEQYEVIPSGKYGIVQRSLFPSQEINATKSISNPPFNVKIDGVNLNYEFVSHCMNQSKEGVFILPNNVLTDKNQYKQRRKLIDDGLIKTVITLSGGFFESTGIPVCLLICSHSKSENPGVMFINAEELSETEVRLQRGEGSASHRNRIYKKNLTVLSKEGIFALREMMTRETQLSKFVRIEEIRDKDYELNKGRYIEFEPDSDHSFHRSFIDIIKEINKIGASRNSFKITINKIWARELGLNTLIELQEKDKQLVTEINKSLKSIGIKEDIIQPDYISQTNSKELTIRQADKEILSPVMVSFVPLLQQHLRTMNIMENYLLQELRDALLPALMSGRITFQDDDTMDETNAPRDVGGSTRGVGGLNL